MVHAVAFQENFLSGFNLGDSIWHVHMAVLLNTMLLSKLMPL